MPRPLALILVVLALTACRTPPLDYDGGVAGSDLAAGARDLAVAPDLHAAPTSCCGKPGNPGNELGVGEFCHTNAECTKKATTCASSFGPGLNFCTMPCAMGGGNAQCGSGAQCECGQGQCVCVPGECLMPPPGC